MESAQGGHKDADIAEAGLLGEDHDALIELQQALNELTDNDDD